MKGTYVLVTELKKDSKIKIGKLGHINFKKGYYCYVGSALDNSTSLKNRTERHKKLNKEKSGKIHWHIDYFLISPDVDIIQIDKLETNERKECQVSKMFDKTAKDSIRGFGCSDCNCKSHFYYFDDRSYDKILEEWWFELRS